MTGLNKLTKDNILNLTVGGSEIFKFYIVDFTEFGRALKSPLRIDNQPSASVFKSHSGVYLYKDFAEGKVLNAIDFVMNLKSINYREAMELINKDLGLGFSEAAKKVDFEGGGTLNYWKQYNLTSEVLDKYRVDTWGKFKTNNGIEVRATKTNPIFSFKIAEDAYKIYMPLVGNKKFKHQWVGQKPREYCDVYGVEQLPEHCATILIVEGLKDCVVSNGNLNDDGIWAVGIDNIGTGINSRVLELLKSKCDNLVFCLDIDERGLEGSSKKSTMYGLRNFILPSILKNSGGKDIANWFQLKLDKQVLLDELGRVLASQEPSKEKIVRNPMLAKLLQSEQLIAEHASKEIIYSPPLISHGETPVIREGTINIVQGKYGSHKTRIVELCCSLLLSGPDCTSDFLGLQKIDSKQVTVLYIDTERNLKEELPTGIQTIKNKACIDIGTKTSTFRFTSIKSIERSKRLDAMKDFINEVRSETTNHIFIVLDVGTDLVTDFNSVSESMRLFDYLGNLSDNFNATFLLIIHENPNSEKARGHIGSESANKGSTVIHIGFVKDARNNDTQLIKLKFLKIRSAMRPDPLYLVYSDTAKGLVLADRELVRQKTAERRQIADVEMVSEKIGFIFREATMTQKELIEILKVEFECSENTLKDRLKDIEEQQIEITNIRSEPCTLKTHSAAGKATYYELVVQTIEE